MTGAAQSTPLSVSLIIVSRRRPEGLRRLLSALRFQTCPDFEVIVVSDQPDLKGFPGADRLRHVCFDVANISAARNIGLSMAQADVVAFCDDDAVPDPLWLDRLRAPFSDPAVGISGGYVRGRNGISYQWKAVTCDLAGDDAALPIAGDDPVIVLPAMGRYPRVHGTNCAFRTDALCRIGGFDEGFRFFLDETDVCLRLGQAGWATGFVPLAQVHHGFEKSERRTRARVPRTLFDVGASKARFVQKHAASAPDRALARLLRERRAQLIRLMVAGRIEPRDVGRLLKSLRAGMRHRGPPPVSGALRRRQTAGAIPFNAAPATRAVILFGPLHKGRKLAETARKLGRRGIRVMVFRFSFTTLFHKRWYDQTGFWVQSGGIFGKSSRGGPLLRWTTLRKRAERERQAMTPLFPSERLVGLKNIRSFVSDSPK